MEVGALDFFGCFVKKIAECLQRVRLRARWGKLLSKTWRTPKMYLALCRSNSGSRSTHVRHASGY